MPLILTAADIVPFASAHLPEDDLSANGGAVNPQIRVSFVDITAGTVLQGLSSSDADQTQTMTVVVRQADGSVASQTVPLTGQTPVSFAALGVLDRVQSATLNSTCAGNVTLRRTTGVQVGIIPAGELGFTRLFQNAIADVAVTNQYYHKIFFKNTNQTNALLLPTIRQFASPSSTLTFAIANVFDDSGQAANRRTPPAAGILSGTGLFDVNDKQLPGTSLSAGHAIGVWIRLSIPPNTAPISGIDRLQIIGQIV